CPTVRCLRGHVHLPGPGPTGRVRRGVGKRARRRVRALPDGYRKARPPPDVPPVPRGSRSVRRPPPTGGPSFLGRGLPAAWGCGHAVPRAVARVVARG